MKKEFEKFLKSPFGLEIRSGEKIVFRSKKAGVRGLVEFIKRYGKRFKNLIIFDKIVGQGAALLAAYLSAEKVYGKTGSKLAEKTLKRFKIKIYFKKTVDNILDKKKKDLCPLEKKSFSRTPEEFYKHLIK